MTEFYKIKAFSQLSGVTIRTLQYYDEVGLLKPTGRTESGYRLYAQHDLLRLQQIVTLKHFGFPLSQIQEILDNPDYELAKALTTQMQVFQEKAEQFEQLTRFMKVLQESIVTHSEPDWNVLISMIKVMHMTTTDRDKWVEQYFTKDEIKHFASVEAISDEAMAAYGQKWEAMFKKVANHLDLPVDSKAAIALADEWMSLVNEVYGDCPDEVLHKFWEAFKTGTVFKGDMPYYRQDVVDFIAEAIVHRDKR